MLPTIEVSAPISYRGSTIYVRKIGNLFEYLIVRRKKLYGSHFTIETKWRRKPTPEQIKTAMLQAVTLARGAVDEMEAIWQQRVPTNARDHNRSRA